jgi:predicted LPLAT superfamily acyltransferase
MNWASQPERGTPRLTRAALYLALHGAGPILVALGTAWFLLTAPTARHASRDYLRRVLGRPARLAEIGRHFHSFACAIVDRALLLAGRNDAFRIHTTGLDTVLDALAQGRGCILLGAHLGSFEVLRTVAQHAPVPVWALMYRRNAGALTTLLDRLAPALHDRVLEIGDTASMIQARECIERGEIVGILADRAPPDRSAPGHRMVAVPFLGAPAAFPSGPFILANTLAAPVVLFHAIGTGPRTYDVAFEPFADRVTLRRTARTEDLHAVIARYAAAIERGCRAHPYQWFNFYSFWEGGHDAARETDPASPPRAAPRLAATRSG